MTRIFLPDARSLALADVPILPFLAPRIFAEPPFGCATARHRIRPPKHTSSQNGDSEREYSTARPASVSTARATTIRCTSDFRTSCASGTHRGIVSTLPMRCFVPRPGYGALKTSYADSFHCSRQDLARYSTVAASGIAFQDADADIERILHDEDDLLPLRTAAPDKVLPRSIRRMALASKEGSAESTTKGVHWTIESRRRKAYKRELSRYHTYMAKNTTSQTRLRNLLVNGRFRSLRRRLFALRQSSQTTLDLSCQRPHTVLSVLLHGFAALDRRAHPSQKRERHAIMLQHDPLVAQWAAQLCNGIGEDVGAEAQEKQIWMRWESLDKEVRNSHWHLILLYTLDRRRRYALSFIRVLLQENTINNILPEILVDAMEHLAVVSSQGLQSNYRASDVAMMVPTFVQLVRGHLGAYKYRYIYSQELLLRMGQLASLNDSRVLVDVLIEMDIYIGIDTLLHYANKFGEAGDHSYALRCLQHVLDKASNQTAAYMAVSRKNFIWTCALILRRSTRDGQNYHATTEIVASFLKLGVKLDILLYNIIMSNAMEAGDHATAFRVFEVLGENDLSPDKYTYSILLNGCARSEDPTRFREFAAECFQKAKELQDPWLAADYLYYLYVQHREDDAETIASILGHAYSQLFTADALYGLIASPDRDMQHVSERKAMLPPTLLEPPPMALYIMLQAEIMKALSFSNEQVWNLYQHIVGLVRAGDYPVLSRLAGNPVLWNAFLLAFSQTQQFANASAIIKSMTDREIIGIPQPNVYSWNIFMNGFLKNDQTRAVERVNEIMRSRGVHPDHCTYAVLLRSYARKQHIGKVGELFGEMKSDEEEMDPVILRALSKIHDRQKLMFELDRVRKEKEEERALREKASEEEEKRRWANVKFGSMLRSSSSSNRLPGMSFLDAEPEEEKSGESGDSPSSSSIAKADLLAEEDIGRKLFIRREAATVEMRPHAGSRSTRHRPNTRRQPKN